MGQMPILARWVDTSKGDDQNSQTCRRLAPKSGNPPGQNQLTPFLNVGSPHHGTNIVLARAQEEV